MDLLLPLLIALQPTAPKPFPAAPSPFCPPVTVGRLENGTELRLAMPQYSSYYGAQVALLLSRAASDFPTHLIRVDRSYWGDGRPLIAVPASPLPEGGWQSLQISRTGLAALGAASDIALVARGGETLDFVPDIIGIEAFVTCINGLPPGTNETPADAPSNGWRFVPLPPNRLPSYGLMPRLAYPQAALREDRQGMTLVEITVQPDGSTSGCVIIRSSGSADLDEAACNGAARIRFLVATDANGAPISLPVRIPFAWRIAG